jgi:chromosome segregation ATPase
LPPGSLPQYVHDGQAATPEDPKNRVFDKYGEQIYLRPLRDYAFSFRELRHQRPALQDGVLAITNDLNALDSAKMRIEAQAKSRTEEITKVEDEKKTAEADRETYKEALDKLVAEIAELRTGNDELLEKNRELARQIVQAQSLTPPVVQAELRLPRPEMTAR